MRQDRKWEEVQRQGRDAKYVTICDTKSMAPATCIEWSMEKPGMMRIFRRWEWKGHGIIL
jgi:hypothetical protein